MKNRNKTIYKTLLVKLEKSYPLIQTQICFITRHHSWCILCVIVHICGPQLLDIIGPLIMLELYKKFKLIIVNISGVLTCIILCKENGTTQPENYVDATMENTEQPFIFQF